MRWASLVVVCLTGIVAYGGCASEEGAKIFSGDAGSCDVTMCPPMGMGTPCCAENGKCGTDVGTGCIANPDPPDAS